MGMVAEKTNLPLLRFFLQIAFLPISSCMFFTRPTLTLRPPSTAATPPADDTQEAAVEPPSTDDIEAPVEPPSTDTEAADRICEATTV